MDYGLQVPTYIDMWKEVVRAEEAGFTHAWFPDSQLIWSDCYAAMALAAIDPAGGREIIDDFAREVVHKRGLGPFITTLSIRIPVISIGATLQAESTTTDWSVCGRRRLLRFAEAAGFDRTDCLAWQSC